ncbi:alpha/beta-hydrolase [Rhizodiscina lignyota]|uniref:Alpha/beta-hydrolase n=1 Tax=Rhizodiscina lignyota TaxID=1504668 RepID=A0A9P4MAR0_9PEZI|nr:alpha/beta-hydrolase [Rhizodiscina lignyota]
MESFMLETPHGALHTAYSKPTSGSTSNPTILFLHGNSSSSQIFEPLLSNSTLKSKYPLLIFDLPGHGFSKDAPNPEQSYHQPGYADAALHVLRHYGVKEFIALGWSLGGHNAIEMIPLLSSPTTNSTGIKCLGFMIVGTPPAKGAQQLLDGFHNDISTGPAAMNVLPEELSFAFAEAMTKVKPAPAWLHETVKRTDGRTREIMFRAFHEGQGSDQGQVVREWDEGWVAIVNGKEEPYVRLDYCAEVGKGAKKLWQGHTIEIEGTEHAPFFEAPEKFTPVFLQFVEDCAKVGKA